MLCTSRGSIPVRAFCSASWCCSCWPAERSSPSGPCKSSPLRARGRRLWFAARGLQESLEAVRTFRGYAWSQWFAGNFLALLSYLAALLGSGSPLVKSGARRAVLAGVARVAWPVDRHTGRHGCCRAVRVALLPGSRSSHSHRSSANSSRSSMRSPSASPHSSAQAVPSVAVFLSTLFNDVWRPCCSRVSPPS